MTHPDLPDCFFRQLDEQRYQPTDATIGPWSTEAQHGGPPIALISDVLNRFPSEQGLKLSRITAEILGPVPVKPCEISVKVVRPGRRIELLLAEMRCEGKPVLLAQGWRLEEAPNSVPAVTDPYTPPPLPEAQPQEFFPGIGYFPYAHALEWRFAEGGFTTLGPATVWTRPRINLVDDRPADPLPALLLMLDSANGISAELDIREWSFVPVDLTLNLHRQPEGEWLGMSTRSIIQPHGIGTVKGKVFDQQGTLGRSLHTLFVRGKQAN